MLLPGFTCCLGLIAHLLLTKSEAITPSLWESWFAPPVRLHLLSFINVYFFFILFMNPKIFKNVRFNSYITEYQNEFLNRFSRERNCPKTELVREAIHCWLRDRGVDDGLSYDWKDHEKRLAEIFPWWRKEEEEDRDLEELVRGS